MYAGVKQRKQKLNYQDRTEYIMVGQEQQANNGYMRNVTKPIKQRYEADTELSWKDFEIVNLIASGAITELKPTQLQQSRETIARSAEAAIETIQTIEEINDIYGTPTQN